MIRNDNKQWQIIINNDKNKKQWQRMIRNDNKQWKIIVNNDKQKETMTNNDKKW